MIFVIMWTNTVDSLLTGVSVKRTARVGPCLSLLPLFDSQKDGDCSKTDTSCRSQRCLSHRELTAECLHYCGLHVYKFSIDQISE